MDSETSTRSFWWPVVGSLAFMPIALLLAFYSGGSGHGDYFFAKLLLPYATLFMWSNAGPSAFAPLVLIVLVFAQYPVYGIVLGRANQRDEFYAACAVISLLHAATAALSLVSAE